MKKKYLILNCLLLTFFCSAQDLKIECADSLKINNLETYFDYYKKEVKHYSSSLVLSKEFYNDFFGCSDRNIRKILMNIEITTDGSYVIEKSEKYLPKDNEILFLIENEDQDFLQGKQQIKFRIGSKIKTAILDKSLNAMFIIEFLKCKVIRLKRIPEDAYFIETFESEVNK